MTKIEELERRIELKKQVITLTRYEIDDLTDELATLKANKKFNELRKEF